MKERPILFTAPMVRALLAGTKTQTRRVAPIRKLDITRHPGDMVTWSVSFLKAVKGVFGSHSGGKFSELQAQSIIASQFNPYGQPGDRLWVREAFRAVWSEDHEPPRALTPAHRIWYEADAPHQDGSGKLRPGIFMPRWASRIALEITGLRVERLQDISDDDSLAEGIYPTATGLYPGSPRAAYQKLWEQINGPGSWDANPCVWVIEFRRIS